MSDQIISGTLNITNYNDLSVTVVWENSSGDSFVQVEYTTNSDYSNLHGLPFVSQQSLGGDQYQSIFEETGLAYNTTYYIRIQLKKISDSSVIDTQIGNITTLNGSRITLTLTLTDKNAVSCVIGIRPVQGDPSMIPEVHYRANGNASRADPQPIFTGQSSSGGYYEYSYQADTLLYDTLYNFGVWLVEYGNPSNVIESKDDNIITDQDGSRITSVSVTPEATRATVSANVTLGTQDGYMMKIIYSTNSSLTPSGTKNHDRVDVVSTWDRIFYFNLTNLHPNTKYYYKIELWNTTTNQYIDYKIV